MLHHGCRRFGGGVLLFELVGRTIAQRRMQAARVVIRLPKPRDIAVQLFQRVVALAVELFGFERLDEALVVRGVLPPPPIAANG